MHLPHPKIQMPWKYTEQARRRLEMGTISCRSSLGGPEEAAHLSGGADELTQHRDWAILSQHPPRRGRSPLKHTVAPLWQEEDSSGFTQRHYQPHTSRGRCCERLSCSTLFCEQENWSLEETKGVSCLATQTPHVPPEEILTDIHRHCPWEGIFINSVALEKLFVLSKNKNKNKTREKPCKMMIRMFEWPWESGRTQDWALLAACTTFHISSRSEDRDHRGMPHTRNRGTGTWGSPCWAQDLMTQTWFHLETPCLYLSYTVPLALVAVSPNFPACSNLHCESSIISLCRLIIKCFLPPLYIVIPYEMRARR